MSRTVLIVEDDPRIARWVQVYFERAGFAAEVAHDGAAGLARARELTPDLIILDLMLPRVDGVEVCRTLRRESDVPIIMLTAREAHTERVIGLDSGADDYIVQTLRSGRADRPRRSGAAPGQGPGSAGADTRQYQPQRNRRQCDDRWCNPCR